MMNNLSVLSCLPFVFRSSKFPRPSRRNLHLNHYKALILFFSSFNSISSSFCYRSSSWWLIKDLIHSRSVLQDTCWRSSSILDLAFWSAVFSILSFEVALCHSWQFPSRFMIYKFPGMRYLNPSFSSLELSWYRFHLKPSIGNVSIMVLIYDPISASHLDEGVFISLLTSIRPIAVSERSSPHNFVMLSISPQQAYSFRCWCSNNSVQYLFLNMLSQIHLW